MKKVQVILLIYNIKAMSIIQPAIQINFEKINSVFLNLIELHNTKFKNYEYWHKIALSRI